MTKYRIFTTRFHRSQNNLEFVKGSTVDQNGVVASYNDVCGFVESLTGYDGLLISLDGHLLLAELLEVYKFNAQHILNNHVCLSLLTGVECGDVDNYDNITKTKHYFIQDPLVQAKAIKKVVDALLTNGSYSYTPIRSWVKGYTAPKVLKANLLTVGKVNQLFSEVVCELGKAINTNNLLRGGVRF